MKKETVIFVIFLVGLAVVAMYVLKLLKQTNHAIAVSKE